MSRLYFCDDGRRHPGSECLFHRLRQTGFADLPGSNFTVKGIKTSRDAALIGAGLTADITSSLAMVIDYDAYVSSDQTVHNISGGFKIKW